MMAGYRNGYINLDSPREVFYPGQVVLGSVVFEIEQPFQLSVLFVDYIGEAKVEWSEQESEEHNGVKRYRDVDYVGREEYFNVRQVLAGGNAPLDLPPGTHTYQFSYQIPPGVPSTFSGERGGISYRIKATIDLQGQDGIKDEITKYFEVVAPFNLNLGSPKLKDPIDLEFEEDVGCGCFSSNPLVVRVRVPVSGYCPGQIIPVALEVHNRSNVEVRKIIFQILSRERYRTQHPVSEYIPPERVIHTVTKGSVLSGSKTNTTVEVAVPEIIAANLENCGIIDVGYFFKVIIKLSGCNDDLEDEAEICFGLVPLSETIEGEYTHPLSQSLPIGPIPDIPPVNFEEQRHVGNQQATPGQLPNTGFQSYPGHPAGYPSGPPGYPNGPPGYLFGTGYPNASQSFSTSGFPNAPVQSSYYIEVQQQSYSSSDPSKNFNIGFTMASPGARPPSWAQKDLRIHLPEPGVNVNMPSAPPPSS